MPWAAPSTASAGRCSGSDPCRSFHRAASAGKDAGWPKVSFRPSARRAGWKIIPGCMRARLRAALRLNSASAFPETPRTEPGRSRKRQSSTSRTRALLADSRGRQRASGHWHPRPWKQYRMRSRVRKVPRGMRNLPSFCDVLLSLYQSLTFTEEANKLLRNSLFPPAFDSNESSERVPCKTGGALPVKWSFQRELLRRNPNEAKLIVPATFAGLPGVGPGGRAAVMVNLFNGTTWGTWKSLAGPVSSNPSCTSDGAGKVICAATATNGNLQWSILSGGVWSNPAKVAGALFSAPSCAEYIAGQVLCVARNSSGGLAWSLYNGTSWSAFSNVTTSAVSGAGCATDNAGGVICSIFTNGSGTLVNRFSGGVWQGFLSIGGLAGGQPLCSSMNSGGKVVCFAKAYNSGIYGTLFNGGSWVIGDWTGYGGIGGGVNDNAGCTTQAAGQLVFGAIVDDNAFYVNVYNGSRWSGFAKSGATGVGAPSCAPLGTGQVVCVVLGIDNKLTSVVGP